MFPKPYHDLPGVAIDEGSIMNSLFQIPLADANSLIMSAHKYESYDWS
jgi:hypothetical protein